MTGRAPLRWLLWLALLAGLGWLVATDRRQTVPPALADVPPRKPAPSQPGRDLPAAVTVRDPVPRERLIPPRAPGAARVDLFARRDWAPPPVAAAPPPAPPAAAPAPAAAPFTYLGKRRDEQGWQVYLGRGELAFIVREGDPIEGGYRVESIKPPLLTLGRADGRQQIAIGEWE